MQEYLITLLVKIGVVAAIASFGVRSDAMKRMLQREERTLAQRLRLALWFIALFLPGVAIRTVTHTNYSALDLGLEGSLLAGITGGYVCGWVTGMAVAIPAMLNGEIASLPFSPSSVSGGGCCGIPRLTVKTSGASRPGPKSISTASSSPAENSAAPCYTPISRWACWRQSSCASSWEE